MQLGMAPRAYALRVAALDPSPPSAFGMTMAERSDLLLKALTKVHTDR